MDINSAGTQSAFTDFGSLKDKSNRPSTEHVVGDLYIKCLDLSRHVDELSGQLASMKQENLLISKLLREAHEELDSLKTPDVKTDGL